MYCQLQKENLVVLMYCQLLKEKLWKKIHKLIRVIPCGMESTYALKILNLLLLVIPGGMELTCASVTSLLKKLKSLSLFKKLNILWKQILVQILLMLHTGMEFTIKFTGASSNCNNGE